MIFKSIFKSLFKDVLSISSFQILLGFSQLFLTPLFIEKWGSHYFGEYLLVFSIANFIGASDLGLSSTAVNEIIRLNNSENAKRSKIIQDSSLIAVALISFLTLSLTFLIFSFLYKLQFIQISSLGDDVYKIFGLALLTIWLNIVLSLPLGLYMSVNKLYVERFSSSIFKCIEIAATLMILTYNFNALALLKVLLLIKIFNFIYVFFNLKNYGLQLNLKYRLRFGIVKSLIKPSISTIKIGYTQSFYTQGVNVLIGNFIGPEKLVLFTVYRSLLNGGKQLSNIVNLALLPRFSSEYGKKNWEQINKYIKFGIIIGIVISVLYVSFGLILHDFVLPRLLHEHSSEILVFCIYIVCLIPYSLYSTKLAFFGAINSYSRISNVLLILSSISLVLLYVLCQFNPDMILVGVFLLLYEVASAILIWYKFSKTTLLN